MLQHPTSCPTTKSTETTMVNAAKKNFSPLPASKYSKSTNHSTRRPHQANEGNSSSGAGRFRALRAFCCSRFKEQVSLETRQEMHSIYKRSREREIVPELHWARNHCVITASWRCRNIDYAGTWRYEESWQCRIDNQIAQKNVSRDDSCYCRQSVQSCKFRRWGGLGRWGWWIYRAGQAEQRWWTRLGDGHNLHNGTAGHEEVSAEADEAWQNDTTGMEGQGRLLPWIRYEVQHYWIERSGGY